MRRLSSVLLACLVAIAAVEPAALSCGLSAAAPSPHGCCTPIAVAAVSDDCCAQGAPREPGVPPGSTLPIAPPLAVCPTPAATMSAAIAIRTLPIRTSPAGTIDLPTLYSALLI